MDRPAVIVFTEFGHTLGYLERLLGAAFEGTHLGSERLRTFRGGMDDAKRDEIQRLWNAPPEESPVRILLATDAAREGVNLQGACHHLFHYDVPWNPARLEQRNGRIDRTLQPSPEVYCHYFTYRDRPEDRVLDTLVRKVEVIQKEVGSLGTVILDEIEKLLAAGIGTTTAEQIERAGELKGRREVVKGELERLDDGGRRHLKALEKEIDAAGKILNSSREAVGLKPDLLRQTLDVALGLIGAPPLAPLPGGTYELPALPESWQETLDTLRPHRGPDEAFWEWRRRPPLPISFEPAKTLREDRVHLHLEHPVVKRLLARFLAQGFSADDLSRVTALRDEGDARVHAVLFGRLSLFGQGATRLHDELLSVAARWVDGEAGEPLGEADEAKLVERLWRLFAEENPPAELPEKVKGRLTASVPAVFARLWPVLRDEADHLAHRAEQRLTSRGRTESSDLRTILEEQRKALQDASTRQLTFDFGDHEKEQQRQWENDRRAIEARLLSIDREIDTEPPQLEALFRVALRRLELVGLVFLWPSSR